MNNRCEKQCINVVVLASIFCKGLHNWWILWWSSLPEKRDFDGAQTTRIVFDSEKSVGADKLVCVQLLCSKDGETLQEF